MIITYLHLSVIFALIFTFISFNKFLIFLYFISLIIKYLDHQNSKLKKKIKNLKKEIKNYSGISDPKNNNSKNNFNYQNLIFTSNLYLKQAFNFYNSKRVKEKNIIPLHVYQTFKTLELPQVIKEARDILIKQNPEFDFHLYDDNMCREFIKNNFNEDTLFAFDNLIPGAYKADLWRYCVLYINGGIYIDIKFIIDSKSPIKFIDLINEEYLVRDIIIKPNSLECEEFIYQAFIVSKPKNEILKKCIEKIVFNVRNRVYTWSTLGVTGPKLIKDIVYENIDICNYNLYCLRNNRPSKNLVCHLYSYITFNNNKFLVKYKPCEYYNQIIKYHELWENRQVFSNQLEKKYNDKIPKIIYFCNKKICKNTKYQANLWKQLNPEYEIRIYDDIMCQNFLKEKFSETHSDLFNFLEDGPIKADFWRICILYLYGGIYSDIDNVPLVKLSSFINPISDFVVPSSYWIEKFNFNPNFIVTVPKSPILKSCIDWYLNKYKNNIEYDFYEYSVMKTFTDVIKLDNCRKYGLYDYNDIILQIIEEKKGTDHYDAHNIYEDKRVFNNRTKLYNHKSHSFKND